MRIVTAAAEWKATLARCPDHDFYHTFDFHAAGFGDSSGTPKLFVYEQPGVLVALPLVLRQGEIGGQVFVDATSTYGYAGPVAAVEDQGTDHQREFRDHLREALASLGVVSVFSRLHPLLDNSTWLEGLGETRKLSHTVAIDLSLDEDEQWRAYRSNLRREVTALRDSDITCENSSSEADYLRFMEIYNATMQRKSAGRSYLIDEEDLRKLRDAEDFETRLYVCRTDSKIIAGALFVRCGAIVQYHLSGTDADFYSVAPNKLILDTVRRWARDAGCRYFHLGGGVGSSDDSLYRFKRGFSRKTFPFRTWQWILDTETYEQLAEGRRNSAGALVDSGFFPAYRSPGS